jgi:hypothetical protein
VLQGWIGRCLFFFETMCSVNYCYCTRQFCFWSKHPVNRVLEVS